jgi:hypothetical protein
MNDTRNSTAVDPLLYLTNAEYFLLLIIVKLVFSNFSLMQFEYRDELYFLLILVCCSSSHTLEKPPSESKLPASLSSIAECGCVVA